MAEPLEAVRCDFDGCESSMMFRVVLAVVDQLGAEADLDLAILESLDVPLEDCIAALSPRQIEEVTVRMDGEVLDVELRLQDAEGILDAAPLGEVTELVESFFDVTFAEQAPHVHLSASVG
ncbi:hypothetical protein [Ilumatobacter nonamiensis]|uniref:hypothetical protein n=1 Tax=Ilumatobacter nonamiensis TaxID=467093 RepID=UPI00058B1209|nr:hypothetical protein [Ilumatobacter nonamiensis]